MKARIIWHQFGVDVFEGEPAIFVGGFGYDKLRQGPIVIAPILAEILKNLGVDVTIERDPADAVAHV